MSDIESSPAIILAFVRSLTILEKLLSAFLTLGLDSLTFGVLAGVVATVGFGAGIDVLAVGLGVAIEIDCGFGRAIDFVAGLTVLVCFLGATTGVLGFIVTLGAFGTEGVGVTTGAGVILPCLTNSALRCCPLTLPLLLSKP